LDREELIVLCKVGSVRELDQLLEWNEIRDLLLKWNQGTQDVEKALELASVCQHPNAVWLTNLCKGKKVTSPEEASIVFRAARDDLRASCLGELILPMEAWTWEVVLRCANQGDTFAAAVASLHCHGDQLALAEKSAEQGERG
jgi:hypothetical protein